MLKIIRSLYLIAIALLISGCMLLRSPFDFPTYPYAAVYVGAVEGYQSTVADGRYNMWFDEFAELYGFQHLLIQDRYLFVAQCGLSIFDISAPEQISLIGNYPDDCGVDDLIIKEKRAYLATRDKGISILDISDVTSIKLLGLYTFRGGSHSTRLRMLVNGEYIYLYTSPSNSALGTSSAISEQPAWQVIHIQIDGLEFQFNRIKIIQGIGQPMVSINNNIYATSQWYQNTHVEDTYLQTIQFKENGDVAVVDTQLITGTVDEMQVNNNDLFVSKGMSLLVWDISNSENPMQIVTLYNTVGPIGDFETFDVDDTFVVGEGHILRYKRNSNSIKFKLYATIQRPDQVTNCHVLMQPTAECQLKLVGKTRQLLDSQGPVLYHNYIFYPYYVTSQEDDVQGFTLTELGIAVYKIPN